MLGDELLSQYCVKHSIAWRSEMNKNALVYGFILATLIMQSGIAFTADESKNRSAKDKTLIELTI